MSDMRHPTESNRWRSQYLRKHPCQDYHVYATSDKLKCHRGIGYLAYPWYQIPPSVSNIGSCP